MRGFITAVTTATLALGAQVPPNSKACLECTTGVCALVPPSGSSTPCYQGAPEDANFCYNTDPLVSKDATHVCDTCSSVGYTTYVQNDPIYKNMELWMKSNTARGVTYSASSLNRGEADPCAGCSGYCSIVPPADSGHPCYEGEVGDAIRCYNTDPLIKDGSVTSCGTCASSGYTDYMRNDPVYRNMALWSRPATVAAKAGILGEPNCNRCTSDVCSIVAPQGVDFPCYQGTIADTNMCFATDPLLAANSTTVCASCTSIGYPQFLRNDPVYRSMQLWGK